MFFSGFFPLCLSRFFTSSLCLPPVSLASVLPVYLFVSLLFSLARVFCDPRICPNCCSPRKRVHFSLQISHVDTYSISSTRQEHRDQGCLGAVVYKNMFHPRTQSSKHACKPFEVLTPVVVSRFAHTQTKNGKSASRYTKQIFKHCQAMSSLNASGSHAAQHIQTHYSTDCAGKNPCLMNARPLQEVIREGTWLLFFECQHRRAQKNEQIMEKS